MGVPDCQERNTGIGGADGNTEHNWSAHDATRGGWRGISR